LLDLSKITFDFGEVSTFGRIEIHGKRTNRDITIEVN